MKKITKLISCLLVASFILTGCNMSNKNEQKEEIKYKNGSFVVSKDGVSEDFSENKNLHLEWYTDAACPDCTRAHTSTNEYFNGQIKSGNVEIKYHFLNFLKDRTMNKYSLNAASWVLGVANYSPNETPKFIELLMQKASKEELETRNVEYFVDLAQKSGVTNDKVELILKNYKELSDIIENSSSNIRENKDLIAKSPKNKMFVPFIFVENDSDCALEGENEDTVCGIINPVKEKIKKLNLKPCVEDKPCEE